MIKWMQNKRRKVLGAYYNLLLECKNLLGDSKSLLSLEDKIRRGRLPGKIILDDVAEELVPNEYFLGFGSETFRSDEEKFARARIASYIIYDIVGLENSRHDESGLASWIDFEIFHIEDPAEGYFGHNHQINFRYMRSRDWRKL